MDTASTTPQPLPRLRVARASPSGPPDGGNASVASSQAGPSRLTDFTQLVDLNLSDIRAAHDYTDEDEEQDQYPTPRMNTTAPLAPSSATPTPSLAGRLRELIQLVPNGSGSQNTPTARPPSPTFHESDFEGELGIAGYSHARESLRGIFSKALREPSGTPQKGEQRTNSGGGSSESDSGPPRDRFDVKGKQRSFSDEESDESAERGAYLTGSSQRTIHRPSHDSSAIEFPLKSISADDSDDAEDSPRPRRISPPGATSTPLQSLRISQNSSFPQHSNLLDQDSGMQRAFGALESFDEPSAQLSESHEPSAHKSTEPNMPTTPGPLGKPAAAERSRDPRNLQGHTPVHPDQTSLMPKYASHNTTRQERSIDVNLRERGQRRTSLQGSMTPLRHKSSSSLQFSDQSSAMSVSDYDERMKEMERERNREREREWNKRQPKNTRPGSSLSLHSPRSEHRSRTSSISSLESPRSGSALSNTSMDSAESPHARVRTMSGLSDRPRTVSGGNRPTSALSNDSTSGVDFSQGLRRHHSLTSGAESPVSSKSASSEIELERERNWNAPRPKWHRRSLPNTPGRPGSPGPPKLPSHSPTIYHLERTSSSSALKDASNTPRSNTSSPITRRHSQSNATPLSPYSERRNAIPASSEKPTHSSRLSRVATSTPARPKSHIPRPISSNSHRSPVPSNRSHVETPKTVPEVHLWNGDEDIQQTKSVVSFPRAVNGQSFSQESMDLTEAYNAHGLASTIPPFSDTSPHIPAPNNDTLHTASLLGPNNSRGTLYEAPDDSNALAPERTPTLQMISPPPEFGDVQEHSSSVGQIHENLTPTHEEFEAESPSSQRTGANQYSIPSFLSTPPRSRQSLFNSSKVQFQTPSPPKGLPDLPGPPSSDDEADYDSLPQFTVTLASADVTPTNEMENRYGNGDFTSFKTPKPPGGWLPTPGPFPVESAAQEDSTSGFVGPLNDGPLRAKAGHSSVFSQTPAPPGGWINTPAAFRRVESDSESVLNEGGLTTPVPSLGRAKTTLLKTPGPAGAWMNTTVAGDTVRKSILKVRFDPEVTNEANESSDMHPDKVPGQTNKSPVVLESLSRGIRSTTPEPATPVTPPSRSPRKHKRSPSVRMVDAYGNEQREGRFRERDAPSPTPATPRDKSGIRIVNTLGQEVREELELTSEALEENTVRLEQVIPVSRVEVLQRVRLGIQELAEGIESLDLKNPPRENDAARIKELDDTSRALKQSREQIAHNMHRAEKDLRRQVQQKVLASNWLSKNVWFLFLVGVIQLLLIFMMYRASVLRARKMFLTNYYDPFNPDLFLYTTNPDTQYATPAMSWNMVAQAVRGGDLKAFTRAFRTNLSILIKRWHQQIWDVWGDDPNRPVGAWPPT